MAEGMTITGLDEFKAAVGRLQGVVLVASRDVAMATALREQETARRLLRSQQTTEAHALADAITIVDDPANKQVLVVSFPPDAEGRYRGRLVQQPANVPIWNEYGTQTMTARPYMRPASDAEEDRYAHDGDAAIATAVEEVLK